LKEALSVFLLAAVAMFFLDKVGALGVLKAGPDPLVVNGLGRFLAKSQMTTAFVVGFQIFLESSL